MPGSETNRQEGDKVDPSDEAERLEQEADEIRDHLGNLVGALDRRRHRVGKPLLVGAAVVLGLAAAGLAVWLLRRRPPSRPRNIALALKRMSDRPDRVATNEPNAAKKIAVAAVAAAASVVGKKLAQRWIAAAKTGQESAG